MNQQTWDQIEAAFDRFPSGRCESISTSEFELAFAGFELPPDYREFILRYGAGLVGTYPIYGLRLAGAMGTIARKRTAIDLTLLFRERAWPGAENWFVFTVDQGGMPIGFATDGSVWISDGDNNQIQKLADDFEDFILKWCLRTKSVS